MTHVTTFTLPPTGEVQDKARVVSWQINPGQSFKRDDVLLEIETDKSIIEIPATVDGKLLEHLVNADSIITINTPLARLELEGVNAEYEKSSESDDVFMAVNPINNNTSISDEPKAYTEYAKTIKQESLTSELDAESFRSISKQPLIDKITNRRFTSPAARHAISKHNIDINQIVGTGPKGRITLFDVLQVTQDIPSQTNTKSTIHSVLVNTRFGSINVKIWESMHISLDMPDIVLIHGLFADSESWASLALSLSRIGQRVVAVDLPSHGLSDAEVSDFHDIVESVGEALKKISKSRLIFVGHSLGGAVAARLACQPSLASQALVLISPLGLGTEIQQNFISGILNAQNNESLGRELAKLTHNKSIPSESFMNNLRAKIHDDYQQLEMICNAITFNGIQQINILSDLHSVICSVAVLHGKSDTIIPWNDVLNVPSKVAIHLASDVGHMPQWEASNLTIDIIKRYVQLSSITQ